MSKIDFTKARALETPTARHIECRARQIKSECARRILDVLDQRSQMNLQAAASIGNLTPEQSAVFAKGCSWISDTLKASRAAIASGEEPEWPDVPAGLVELAEEY